MQAVRRASRAITARYEQALAPVGLTAGQFSILVALSVRGDDGVILGDLAGRLGMDRTTVTRAIAPLERDRLVRTRTAADDARKRLVMLARKGRATLEAAIPLWESAQKDLIKQLGSHRFQQMTETLSDVVR